MWPLLANNGRILYAVCSVFPEEGPRGIEAFCARHPDAKLIPIGPEGENLLSLSPAEGPETPGSVCPLRMTDSFTLYLRKFDVPEETACDHSPGHEHESQCFGLGRRARRSCH